jgi:lysophospholipase L1-like esterase
MRRFAATTALILAAVGGCQAVPPPGPTKLLIASDSTAAHYGPSRYPEMGWGMVLACSLDPSVQVVNLARGGRSTKSFVAEGLWDALLAQASPGDTVLIQFGHNDASANRPERYAAPEAYAANLRRFVADVRARGAQPVLLTPVAQRRFESGRMVETHGPYAPVVKQVARETGAPVIDLNAESQSYFSSIGEEPSKRYFLHYAPGEVAHFPDGKTDDVHFNERGARAAAALVARRLKALRIPISARVRPVAVTADPPVRGGPACA